MEAGSRDIIPPPPSCRLGSLLLLLVFFCYAATDIINTMRAPNNRSLKFGLAFVKMVQLQCFENLSE
jgi:hypothetical protein